MSKRPYEDVKDVYTGGMGSRRRAVARRIEDLGMGSPLVLSMPVDMGPPYDSRVRPAIEALGVSALATGMFLSHFESSPTVGAASSIDAAMQDETASGQDAAPDPQDAAHDPNRDPLWPGCSTSSRPKALSVEHFLILPRCTSPSRPRYGLQPGCTRARSRYAGCTTARGRCPGRCSTKQTSDGQKGLLVAA